MGSANLPNKHIEVSAMAFLWRRKTIRGDSLVRIESIHVTRKYNPSEKARRGRTAT
jgi:hypothetical protein